MSAQMLWHVNQNVCEKDNDDDDVEYICNVPIHVRVFEFDVSIEFFSILLLNHQKK